MLDRRNKVSKLDDGCGFPQDRRARDVHREGMLVRSHTSVAMGCINSWSFLGTGAPESAR